MLKLSCAFVLALPVAGGSAQAQRPVITPRGVVNAASFAGSATGEAVVAGGAIFTIFGQNLAATTQSAAGVPLPTRLGGTSVTVDGIAAPLFYVSPGQINFQVPIATGKRVGQRVPVVVTTAAGASEPVAAFVQEAAAGIFSQNGAGCGPGIIQNVVPDGSVTLNTPANSASPGSFITIYGTGFGPQYSPPQDGQPAQVRPLTQFDYPGLILGLTGFAFNGDVAPWFAGWTPGLVGVAQINVRLGDSVPEGCAVPIRVPDHLTIGVPATLSIRKGGGPCQDAPRASFATLAWRKSVTISPATPSSVAEASFTASFGSAPENLAVAYPDPADPPPGGCRCGNIGLRTGPRCQNAGLVPLDAGPLTLTGPPGGPLTLPLARSVDWSGYTTTLPSGVLEGGTLRVAAPGGADVGAFESELTVPPPIKITTPLPPGTVIDYLTPNFTVNWTNGDPDTVVNLRLVAYWDPDGLKGTACDCKALGSVGKAVVGALNLDGQAVLQIGSRSEYAEVVVTVTPRTSKQTRFSVPGLTRGGLHTWTYEYHFKGLKIL